MASILPTDVPHFILQLGFFVQRADMVSIEALLYILFFMAAKSSVLRAETVAVASIPRFLLLVVDDEGGHFDVLR